jgi:hypothetical protein
MTPTAIRRRRSRTAPAKETLGELADLITRRTSAMSPETGGLRPRWDRITEAEQTELVELTRQAYEGGTFDLGRLSDKRARKWESLVSAASGVKGNAFADWRAQAEIRSIAAEANRLTVRRPFSKREEHGLFDEFYGQLASVPPCLDAEDVAVAVLILAQLHAGAPLAAMSRIERDAGGEPTLIIDAHHGLADGDTNLPTWRQCLEQLERNSWFLVQRSGPEWRIGLGLRAKQAMGKAKAA